MRGATIIAPITAAVESAMMPDAAITVARMSSAQKPDSFVRVSLPTVSRSLPIMRSTSAPVTVGLCVPACCSLTMEDMIADRKPSASARSLNVRLSIVLDAQHDI